MSVKEKHVILSDGIANPIGFIEVRTSKEWLVFSGDDFGSVLTKNLITDTGETVGARNRAALHVMLDEWLDGTWMDT